MNRRVSYVVHWATVSQLYLQLALQKVLFFFSVCDSLCGYCTVGWCKVFFLSLPYLLFFVFSRHCRRSSCAGWDDLLPFLFQCTQEENELLREVSLSIFEEIIPYLVENGFEQSIPALASVIQDLLLGNSLKVNIWSISLSLCRCVCLFVLLIFVPIYLTIWNEMSQSAGSSYISFRKTSFFSLFVFIRKIIGSKRSLESVHNSSYHFR